LKAFRSPLDVPEKRIFGPFPLFENTRLFRRFLPLLFSSLPTFWLVVSLLHSFSFVSRRSLGTGNFKGNLSKIFFFGPPPPLPPRSLFPPRQFPLGSILLPLFEKPPTMQNSSPTCNGGPQDSPPFFFPCFSPLSGKNWIKDPQHHPPPLNVDRTLPCGTFKIHGNAHSDTLTGPWKPSFFPTGGDPSFFSPPTPAQSEVPR